MHDKAIPTLNIHSAPHCAYLEITNAPKEEADGRRHLCNWHLVSDPNLNSTLVVTCP